MFILANALVIFTVILNTIRPIASANEVIGCGGFIKSNTEINFKIIKVKLLTKDGIVKYTTESSPVNGYYMIPIYNKGEYILQVNPPPGWSFEPTEVNVNVDGVNDQCSKNEDINFYFKGFGLSGKVVTIGDSKNNGPSGIKLNLISNNKVIDTTNSGKDGSYYFSNVMPGTYQVEAEHSTIKFTTNKVNVVLSKENWSAKDNILVSGYKIEGLVTSIDNKPIKDAIVELYFSEKTFSNIDTKNFICDQSSNSKADYKICHTRTDSNGKFTFLNVAFGKYKLSSSIQKENLKFSMQPEYLTVDLTKHQDVTLVDSFKLSKVSIASKAFLSDKKEVLDNGEVFINGKKLVESSISKDGTFTLENLSSGSYKVSIKSPHVYFEEKLVNLDLNSPACIEPQTSQHQRLLSLTQFIAKAFDVCGKVKMLDNNAKSNYKSIQIKFFRIDGEKQIFQKSVELDEKFEFCTSLESNSEYAVRSELSNGIEKIIKLVPVEKRIVVRNAPILNINFEQLEAKLDGRINFFANQKVPADFQVTIKAIDSGKDLQIKCKSSSSSSCEFSLTNLLFGDYYLTTNYDSLFCWKTGSSILININSEKQSVLVEQQGYLFNYKISHTDAVIKLVDKKNIVLFTKNILNTNDLEGSVCVKEASSSLSEYNLIIDSCHKYTQSEQEDSIMIAPEFFSKDKNRIELNALKTMVNVDVLFKFDSVLSKVNSDDLTVHVSYDDDKDESEKLIRFKLKSESANELVFTGYSWFTPNEQITLNAKSNKILFEENSKKLRVNQKDCRTANHVQFEAKLGVFLVGTVTPADIDGIELTVKSNSVILFKNIINAANGFRLGPLKPPHTLYEIELNKPGYLFDKTSSSVSNSKNDEFRVDFSANKLGQLKVSVLDSQTRTNLESVLLSLSSENRLFRQTVKTDQNGQATFDNLKPGLYYLIVMMQEYEFTPNSHPIKISDGYQMKLVVEAVRTAYSCMGKVTSINGQAESDVLVEAIGYGGEDLACSTSQESAKVDMGGYRIYNLKPSCHYKLNIKHLNSNVESNSANNNLRIIPEDYEIFVKNADITDANFVVLNRIEKLDVSLAVNFRSLFGATGKQLNSYVKVKLFKTNQPDAVLQTLIAPVNSIVYFNELGRSDPTQHFSVQVSLLSPSAISFTGSLTQQQQTQLQQQSVVQNLELGFYADTAHKHLEVHFDLDRKSYFGFDLKHDQEKQYQNVYFTLPLFILVIGIFFNTKRVKQIVQQVKVTLDQKGGVIKYFQGMVKQETENISSTIKSSKSSYHQLHRSSNRDSSSNNNSDAERTNKYAHQPRNVTTTMPTQYSSNFANNNINNNPDILDNYDDCDLQLIAKTKRIKKVD